MWRAPKFWQRPQSIWQRRLSRLLLPLAMIYGWVALRRQNRKPYRSSLPVICIGNIVAGGAGKTPLTLFLADRLAARGARPFILARGYGGALKGICRVDRDRHDAALVGDEPWMMARYYPTIIGGDRAGAARLAAEQGASILLMDDGFQHSSLYKDISLLVIDEYGFGNGYVLPAGPLRERPAHAFRRADAIILIGDTPLGDAPPDDMPILRGQIEAQRARELPEKLIAFAGIGRPEKFWQTLAQMGAAPLERYGFADHYFFREKDGAFLLSRAAALGADLITTEKDYARLQSARAPSLKRLCAASSVLPVAFAIKKGYEHVLEDIFAKLP